MRKMDFLDQEKVLKEGKKDISDILTLTVL